MSLRERQIEAIKIMINFNVAVKGCDNLDEPTWKILVLDAWGKDIIAPIFTIHDLREQGVTLFLDLHSDRDFIPDVPAVYFIQPTKANVVRLCEDSQNKLYESFYINFISSLPRDLLEDIAQLNIQSNSVSVISKIYDQYLNFLSLEDYLILLKDSRYSKNIPHAIKNAPDSNYFHALNSVLSKDCEIEALLNEIVDGIFSVVVTLGLVPIIQCPKGNAAEIVSKRLDKKIKDNLRDTKNNLFIKDSFSSSYASASYNFDRPLLIVLDRTLDLETPLQHVWTYQALIDDIFRFGLNRVHIESKTLLPPEQVFDILPTDKFWSSQKGSSFPLVAESIQEELEAYKLKEDEIKGLKKVLKNEDNVESLNSLTDNTSKLTSAINSLPQLLETKRILDMHTNIATLLLNEIKSRKIDKFFEAEEKICAKNPDEESLKSLLNTSEVAHNSDDKLRLLLIAHLNNFSSQFNLNEKFEDLRRTHDCDISSLSFIRRLSASMSLSTSPSLNPFNPNQYSGGGIKAVEMFSKLVSKGSQFVMEGVSNLVVKQHKFPLTRILDVLLEKKLSPAEEDDKYLYFDPKILRPISSTLPKNKSSFNHAIVCVIGGGCFSEFQNMMDYIKTKPGKKVTYLATDILNGSRFLHQLTELGKEIK